MDIKLPYRRTHEYKLYRREYMIQYRLKNKAKNTIPLHIKNNDPSLSDKTISQYVKIILRITNKLNDNFIPNLEDALNNIFSNNYTDIDLNIIKKLKYLKRDFIDKMKTLYTNETSLKIYLIPFVRLLSIFKESKYFNLYNILSKYAVKLNTQYENKRDDNSVTDDEKDKIITDFSNETIMENINNLEDVNDKMIYGLYTLLPPRRLEYCNMHVISKNSKRDNTKNYLIIYKGSPYQFVFNDYKTNKTYKEQIIDIPAELSVIIKNYLLANKIKSGMKFIDLNINEFSKLIKKVFNKIYNKNITLNWLRKSYATYINSLNISNNDRTRLSEMMGHSSNQNQKYRKIIL